MTTNLIHGDCLKAMRAMPDNSVDSIVADPPYGLSFMGKRWDYDVPSVEIWAECLRVLKPGGHLLAFAGTRTQHRMAVRIEDAGFEIRDMIAWVYGSGFPKSLDVSKAIDKARTEDLEPTAAVCKWLADRMEEKGVTRRDLCEHFNAANIAQQWTTYWTDGVVKPRVPSWEQWLQLKELLALADTMDAEVWRLNGRKGKPGDTWQSAEVVGEHIGKTPGSGDHRFSVRDSTIRAASERARQWQGWGTALKPALEPITVARKPLVGTVAENVLEHGTGAINVDGCRVGDASRWPANLIHDGSEEVVGLFPSERKTGKGGGAGLGFHGGSGDACPNRGYGDTGSAARFFYCAKASKKDRDEGCEGLEVMEATNRHAFSGLPDQRMEREQERRGARNHHPTVKPTDLMRYLCRLVTPPGGIVLDPFMGSGSTGKAAILEGFHFIGIERDEVYFQIAKTRIEKSKS